MQFSTSFLARWKALPLGVALLSSASAFSAERTSLVPAPVPLFEFSSIGLRSADEQRTLWVLNNGQVYGRVCVPLSYGYPPRHGRTCRDGIFRTLPADTIANLLQLAEESASAPMVKGPKPGEPQCLAAPNATVGYWVKAAATKNRRDRFLYAGTTPCGFFTKNDSKASDEIVGKLTELMFEYEQPVVAPTVVK